MDTPSASPRGLRFFFWMENFNTARLTSSVLFIVATVAASYGIDPIHFRIVFCMK